MLSGNIKSTTELDLGPLGGLEITEKFVEHVLLGNNNMNQMPRSILDKKWAVPRNNCIAG